MAQTARVTLTLSNIATEEDIKNMEERIMSQLSDAIATITAAVNSAIGRMGSPDELQAALVEERRVAAELAASEAAEDVEQNAELQAARAEVDRLMAEQSGAATELVGLADRLNTVGTAVDDADDEMPVGEVPVELPDPDSTVQGPVDGSMDPEVPTEGAGANPTPTDDPSSQPTTDVGVSPDGGAPVDAGPTGPVTGPTDASGNPIEGPRL